ncbi:MAG: hypothetical protein KF708_05150 [Pirellulales bacterium]|nr:hypothetical protein [Pirellulales bacterium]
MTALRRLQTCRLAWCALFVALPLLTVSGQDMAADPFAPTATLYTPAPEEVRAQAFAWLTEQEATPEILSAAERIWDPRHLEPTGAALLDRLAETVALVDPQARELVTLCSMPRTTTLLPAGEWLHDDSRPAFVRDNLRLLYGRWLSQESLYDEALRQIGELSPEQVVDPATLLFHQAVAYHRLVEQEPGMQALTRLLDDVGDAPERYKTVATLMREDLAAVEVDSLDHIARRMDDIRRRLELGRAGQKVLDVEDGVIESLDKLIEELEKQQQQQQQQQQSSSGGAPSSTPMQDSRIAGAAGKGDVTKRDIGSGDGWGALPPKEREEALQQIGKDFPPHYRDVIEQYFRKLATEQADGAPLETP